jgi:predicted flap endonuclease-1-like 5' DNA nuclease
MGNMDWSLILQMLGCLLLAGILGAILGWLLGKATGGGKLKEIENSWSARFNSKEGELFAYQNRSRERIDMLESELKTAREKIELHGNTIVELHKNADHLTAEVSNKTNELAAAQTAVANAQSISHSDASEIARLRSAVAAAETDAALKGKAQADFQAQLQASNQKLALKESELTDTLAKVAAGAVIGSQLNESTEKITTLETQLNDAGKAISFRDAEISKMRVRLHELEASTVKLKDCESRNHSKDAEIAALHSQLSTNQSHFAAEITALKSTASAAPILIETDLIRIQGIGNAFFEKLKSLSITTQAELLRHGNTKIGRAELAAKSGIDERLILTWVNHVDLIRINGIDEQYAKLLEVAGVDTVPELAMRKADNLHAKLVDVNNVEQRISPTTPTLLEVQSWIGHAKTLPKIVTH